LRTDDRQLPGYIVDGHNVKPERACLDVPFPHERERQRLFFRIIGTGNSVAAQTMS